jgi:hypothetical protein
MTSIQQLKSSKTDYAIHESLTEFSLPHLDISGLGAISLPLQQESAQNIAKHYF